VVVCLKPNGGHDVAGEAGVAVLTAVRVHLEQSPDALFASFVVLVTVPPLRSVPE